MKAPGTENKYGLESVDRMMSVLTALEANAPCSLDRVARAASLSEATALRYLSSLSKHELVQRDSRTGSYRLGLNLFRLGSLAIAQRDISPLVEPSMSELCKRFDETVNLAARQRNQIVVVMVSESPNSMRKGARPGETDTWHATALGKAFLAAMDDGERNNILNAISFVGFTPNTLTSRDELERDITIVKKRGYSIDDEEAVEGLRCVSAPILDHSHSPAYALSISGPKSRMSYSRIQEIGEALSVTAGNLSEVLGAET